MKKTVRIYIETSFKGPVVKDGKYAAILEFTKSTGERATRIVSGEEKATTYNRCTLLAIIQALRRLKFQCHVILYTGNAYVKDMIEQENPEKWRREEWKKAAGREVQNKELWKLFLEEKDKQEIEVRFSIFNEYRETLHAIMDGEEI